MNLIDSFDLLHHLSLRLWVWTGIVQPTWRDKKEHWKAAKDKLQQKE